MNREVVPSFSILETKKNEFTVYNYLFVKNQVQI